MSNYYGVRTINGEEPCGTDGKLMFRMDTNGEAIAYARRHFIAYPKCEIPIFQTNHFRLYRYLNFYRQETFTLVHEQ